MQNPLTHLPAPLPSQAPQPGTQAPRPRRRRWLKVFVGLFVLLLFLVGAAPTIIAKTGLRNRIARLAVPDLNGTLDIGGASLGWFSPIELRDVSLTDPQGRVVAHVPKVTSSKSLFSLIRNRAALGEFTLDRPNVDVVCEKNSSNLEEVLKKFFQDDGSPRGTTRPEVTVRVTGGTLILRDAEKGMSGEFRDLDATIHCPALRSDPVTVKLSRERAGKTRRGHRRGRLRSHQALDERPRSGIAGASASSRRTESRGRRVAHSRPDSNLEQRLRDYRRQARRAEPRARRTVVERRHAAIRFGRSSAENGQ